VARISPFSSAFLRSSSVSVFTRSWFFFAHFWKSSQIKSLSLTRSSGDVGAMGLNVSLSNARCCFSSLESRAVRPLRSSTSQTNFSLSVSRSKMGFPLSSLANFCSLIVRGNSQLTRSIPPPRMTSAVNLIASLTSSRPRLRASSENAFCW